MDNNFNNYSAKIYGKILDFDGEAGIIATTDNKYPFSVKDIKNNDDLAIGDIITFRVNRLPFGNEVIDIAKFITKEKETKTK